MRSYLSAMFGVLAGYFVMNVMEIGNDCNPQLEESDFIDLNPFSNWK